MQPHKEKVPTRESTNISINKLVFGANSSEYIHLKSVARKVFFLLDMCLRQHAAAFDGADVFFPETFVRRKC